jgi:histidine ammonia-lyase
MTIQIDGNHLTIENVVNVARYGEKVGLSPAARQRTAQTHSWVEQIAASDRPVYGINTGFGVFANQKISGKDSKALSRNLILSHAVSTGPDLPIEVVRAAMIIRANTLSSGYSGVRPELIEILLEMLNRGVTPIVPSQGSLGSSGDLAPLSHLALVFTTDEQDRETESGQAFYGAANGTRMSGKSAMAAAELKRMVLGPKEGLALTNGATFSAAIAALAIHDAENLLRTAEISLGLSLEALLGVSNAFDVRLHTLRHHPGQKDVAARVRKLTHGSTLLDAEGRIQDAYSLRCAPQVQGAACDAFGFVQEVISREINAVTDNPLILGPDEAISGGNFHGEPIGLGMDFLSLAMTEVAAISERRIFRLTDGHLNAGLPPMLVDSFQAAGLNSGMMMLQYTAASLVLENQTLANADSIHSLPTSAEQEDHNANSMTAARNTIKIIENTAHVLAIEVYCAARGIDLRLRQMPQAKLGLGTAAAHKKVRQTVPYQSGDAWWGPEIEKIRALITSGELVGATNKFVLPID